MAKKKTSTKRASRRTRDYEPLGPLAEADDLFAVYFDYDDDDGVDMDSIDHERVQCLATARVGGAVKICGVVSGIDGLEIVEQYDDFRGYVHAEPQDFNRELSKFVDAWEKEHLDLEDDAEEELQED